MGEDLHRLEIVPAEEWLETAAAMLASAVQWAVDERGRCLLGISGGVTSADVFDRLTSHPLDWDQVVVVQLDERIAPPDTNERFVRRQQDAFAGLPVTWVGLPIDALVDLPLDALANGERTDSPAWSALERVTTEVTSRLVALAGDPPVLDIIQLGLGRDGHTVSLFAGDRAVTELRRYVTVTGRHQGYHRLTLTRPVLDRARLALWLVRGEVKAPALGHLLAGDLNMPAGLVRAQESVILADTGAARQS
jgi:6-phosphogluconolactonase